MQDDDCEHHGTGRSGTITGGAIHSVRRKLRHGMLLAFFAMGALATLSHR